MSGGSTSTLEDFEFLGELGRGAFGVVHRVRRKVDGQLYVLKQISLRNLSLKEQNACVTEVKLLAAVDSESIVRYYDSFISHSSTVASGDATSAGSDSGGMLNLVQEYCEGGDLQQYIRRHQQQHPDGALLPEPTIWSFFIQMLLALAALHSHRILHRDLKPANFFLAKGGRLKLGDLGVAKLLSTESAYGVTQVGTPYFLSPELCEGKSYNEKSDLWSAGVCLYQMLTLRQPFEAGNQGALILKIMRGKYPPLPGKYAGTKFPQILDALLRKDTNLRPTAVQVLASLAVYSKARELGWAVPQEVEKVVERRKQGQRGEKSKAATQRQVAPTMPKSRTQGLPSHEPSSSPTAAASAAGASFHRTAVLLPTKKTHRIAAGGGRVRGRMGNSSVLTNAPMISGVAPARPTPGLVQPILRPPKQPSGVRKPKRSPPAEAAAVADLPDHVPGAPVPRPIGSFVPSPETERTAAAGLQWPQQQGQMRSAGVATGKPSVRAFQQALSSPFAAAASPPPPTSSQQLLSTAHFASAALAATDASIVNHASSNEQSMRSDRSQGDGEDEFSSREQSAEDDSTSGAEDSSAEFLVDGVSSFSTSSDSLDTELVDTTCEDHCSLLSGSADEVQWRILEEEMDEHARQEAEQCGAGLYDEEEEEETEDTDSTESSFQHNTTLPPTSTSSSIPPLSHHRLPASDLLRAVQARIEHLRTHQAHLQQEVETVVGEEGCEELYQHFSMQAAAGSASSSSAEELDDDPPAGSSPPLLPAPIRSLLDSGRRRRPEFDPLTRVYQMIYLDDEIQRCQAVLRQRAGASEGVDGSAGEQSERRNHTPRLQEPTDALDITSNLTMKRQAVLHRTAK